MTTLFSLPPRLHVSLLVPAASPTAGVFHGALWRYRRCDHRLRRRVCRRLLPATASGDIDGGRRGHGGGASVQSALCPHAECPALVYSPGGKCFAYCASFVPWTVGGYLAKRSTASRKRLRHFHSSFGQPSPGPLSPVGGPRSERLDGGVDLFGNLMLKRQKCCVSGEPLAEWGHG